MEPQTAADSTTAISPPEIEPSRFHCCSEWHLARLKSNIACAYYGFALRIQKNSRKFSVSDGSAATFLDVHDDTIYRARNELVSTGWFELIEYGMFDTNVYRVLTHKEWAEKHPDKCAVKEQFCWTGQGDPLGQQLYAASGCRVKFKEFQIAAYRKLGVTDENIVAVFTEWREGIGRHRKAKNVGYHFLMHLRELMAAGTLTRGARVN